MIRTKKGSFPHKHKSQREKATKLRALHLLDKGKKVKYLFLRRHNESGAVAGQSTRLWGQFDVGANKALGHDINFLDGIIDTARKDGLAQGDHAIHLVSVTSTGDSVVVACCHIPAGYNTVVWASEYGASILT